MEAHVFAAEHLHDLTGVRGLSRLNADAINS
jgi:hypothetical protein